MAMNYTKLSLLYGGLEGCGRTDDLLTGGNDSCGDMLNNLLRCLLAPSSNVGLKCAWRATLLHPTLQSKPNVSLGNVKPA